MMFEEIKKRCDILIENFHEISQERKTILSTIAQHISHKLQLGEIVKLQFICTHNSRRSHLGQIWSSVSAQYVQLPNIISFSGGTEATALHTNILATLKSQGFQIEHQNESENPLYYVYFGEQNFTTCFSKEYNHESNPQEHFIALMTCSEANEQCPIVKGSEIKFSLTYNDPKAYDNTNLQIEKYLERSNQIAMECLYLFTNIKTN